jgi:hypothetical protein
MVLLPAMIAALQLAPVAPRVVFEPPKPLEGPWAIEVCHLSAPLPADDPSPPVLLWSIPLR